MLHVNHSNDERILNELRDLIYRFRHGRAFVKDYNIVSGRMEQTIHRFEFIDLGPEEPPKPVVKVVKERKKKSLEERFWKHVDKDGPIPKHIQEIGNCWNWTGAVSGNGYGQFNIGGKTKGAHRVAFELSRESLDLNLDICHYCDNTICCRPSHLFSGTEQDNMDDMIKKNRGWWIKYNEISPPKK